jgi:sterol desaturase/sphingolipid hydroxylase (fatty acid hydroxylase superfamily)
VAAYKALAAEPFTFIERVTTPIDVRAEARIARRRLTPATIIYSVYALTLLAWGLRGPQRAAVLGWFAAGVAIWTYVEYLVHRYVLHGIFPAGPGPWRRFLNQAFDHLHIEHHRRPWDGAHINGTLKDTGPYVALFVALGYLAPFHTLPMLVAGFMQAYIVEEWVHQSVHFYDFKGRYWDYIRRHHRYHHSPKGAEVAFGLSNGVWDVVCWTRIPAPVRRALYHKRKAAPARAWRLRPAS